MQVEMKMQRQRITEIYFCLQENRGEGEWKEEGGYQKAGETGGRGEWGACCPGVGAGERGEKIFNSNSCGIIC